MNDTKFIRRNGRIIPIKKKSDSNHGKFFAAGMGTKVFEKMTRTVPTVVKVGPFAAGFKSQGKTAKAISAVAAVGILGANIRDSFKHGSSEGSFTSGVGRFLANSLSRLGGRFAGGLAYNKVAPAISGLKKSKSMVIKGGFKGTSVGTSYKRLK